MFVHLFFVCCFHAIFWTDWPLTFTLIIINGLYVIEIQGHKSRSEVTASVYATQVYAAVCWELINGFIAAAIDAATIFC